MPTRNKITVKFGESLRHSLAYNSMEASFEITMQTTPEKLEATMDRMEKLVRKRLNKKYNDQCGVLVKIANRTSK